MQIIRSPKAAPLTYAERGHFRRPRGDQSFSDVVRRVRLFSQESLITIGTRILWKAFREPELLEQGQPHWLGRNIVALFADRLVALACIHANNCRPPATEKEFDLLCWELHNCGDTELTDPATDGEVGPRISMIENPVLRTALEAIPGRAVLVESFRARLAAFQVAGRWDGLADLIRPMLIAEHLTREVVERCGAAAAARISQALQGTEVQFFRNGLVLNGLLTQGLLLAASNGGPPIREYGITHLDNGPIGDAELKEMGVTGEGVRAFALRLSRVLDGFGPLRDDLARIPEGERKYSQHVNWLGRWPLIDLGVRGSARRLVAPSPRCFAKSLERFLLYTLPRVLVADGLRDAKGRELNENDITSLRGAAYGGYLRGVLGPAGAVDADTLEGVAGKRPDFVWAGEQYGLLIEAKFSLLPGDDRALANFSAAVTTWERAYDALEQATEFATRNRAQLARRWPGVEAWLPVVVVHDALPDETTRFKVMAKRAGLKNAQFPALALLSTSELEKWVARSTPDALSAEAIRVWSQIDPNAVSDEVLLREPGKGDDLAPHLRSAFTRILPGANFERIVGGAV